MTIARTLAELRVAATIMAGRDHVVIPIYDSIGAGTYAKAQQIATTPKHRTVAVVIDSPGGSVGAAQAVVRAIEARGGPSVAVGVREVASAAALIFAACGRRYAYADTTFLLHSTGFEQFDLVGRQTASGLRRHADRLAETDAWVVNRLVRTTGLPAAEIVQLLEDETEMSAIKAKSIGLVSSIIERAQPKAEPERVRPRAHAPAPLPALARGLMQADPRMMGLAMMGRPIGMAPRAFEAVLARHWSTLGAGR